MTNKKITSNKKEISQAFNKYFIEAAENILRTNNKDKLKLKRPTNKTSIVNFYMSKVDESEVLEEISKLKSKASPGYDGLKASLIKKLNDVLAPYLVKLINVIISTGIFPDCLKRARVTPVYKEGQKFLCSNYRPISVLPVFSKLVEQIILKRLNAFLSDNNIISEKQNGFQKGKSTHSSLINVYEHILSNLDERNKARILLLDFRKAFDLVNHDLLLSKLEAIGVIGTPLLLFKNYLFNRMQCVKINNVESEFKEIKYGVPQGSLLGPVLFLIFINDISCLKTKGMLSLFADDVALIYTGSNDTLISSIKDDLKKILHWSNENGMVLNEGKCQQLIIDKHHGLQESDNDDIVLNGKNIDSKDEVKYLGIVFDKRFNFSSHAIYVKNKLRSMCGMLRKASVFMTRKSKFLFYNSYVYPYLIYCALYLNGACKKNILILQRIQNKILKLLFNYPRLTSENIIYKDLNLLNIKNIIKSESCKTIYKMFNNMLHCPFDIRTNSEIHSHQTRQRNNIHLNPTNTCSGTSKLSHAAVQQFNQLPDAIKNIGDWETFKKNLRKHLLENINRNN